MSFGFGIGDAIAVVGLLERLAEEVRSYRDAPGHFQNLGIELLLLRRALQRLLEVQPADDNEHDLLQQIRAIAMHCRQPLLTFIDKMRPKEASLGPVRSTGTLSTIAKRLHWSLISKKDVGELRQVVASEIAAINMLLAIQQLEHLRKLVPSQDQSSSATELHEFYSASKNYFKKSMTVLTTVDKTPAALEQLEALVSRGMSQQEGLVRETRDQVNVVSRNVSALTVHVRSASVIVKRIEGCIFQVIRTLVSLAKDMRKLVVVLAHLSKDIAHKIALHGKLLLDIHAMMKRLVVAVEALPLHLTLAIVRLDDALGESWALPYRVCQTFDAFRKVLQDVVFSNGRNGALRVELGQYVLRTARSGQVVEAGNWQYLVKEGGHISQAMLEKILKAGMHLPQLVSRQDVKLQECGFQGCLGFVSMEGEPCTVCGRLTTLGLEHQNHGQTVSTSSRSTNITNIPDRSRFPKSAIKMTIAMGVDSHRVIDSVHELNAVDLGKTLQDRYQMLDLNSAKASHNRYNDDVSSFQNVQMVDCPRRFFSIEDAVRAAAENPLNAYAHQQIGFYILIEDLSDSLTGKFASEHLKWSTILDPSNFLNWYYLGRAYMRKGAYEKAHEVYRQALVLKPTHPTIWRSLAVMHFRVCRYQDSLDALEHCFNLSVKSNPTDQWNLAVLYWYWTNDRTKVAEALEKYLELVPDDRWGCYAWLENYRAGNAKESPWMLHETQMIEPPLLDRPSTSRFNPKRTKRRQLNPLSEMPDIENDCSRREKLTFGPRIQLHYTWTSADYDRRVEDATLKRLTPMRAQAIKDELNSFKMEMEVHESSRVYTHFF